MNEAAMAGRFYYSKKMRKWLDREGRPRFFCIIAGDIKEYTELITVESLLDEPTMQPLYDDAEFLGEGFYSHSIDSTRM